MKYSDFSEGPSISLVLSPWDAEQLDALLDRIPNNSSKDVPCLKELQQRLQDARALATWLRENVILEMLPKEAAYLNDLLASDSIQPSSLRHTHDTLLVVRATLRSELAERQAASLAISAADNN